MTSSRPVPAQRDLPSTLEGLLALVVKGIGADTAAIYLSDDGGGNLKLVAARGLPESAIGHRVAPGKGLVGRVAMEGRSLLSDDVTSDPRTGRRRPDWEGSEGRPAIRSVLDVPLRAGTTTIGVLELGSFRAYAFSVSQRGQASIMADAAGLLIEQTRLTVQPPSAAIQGESLPGDDSFGVVTLDAELRIASASPTFCRLAAQPVEALIGRPILTILPGLGRPRARDALAAAQHGAPGHLSGISLALPDGHTAELSMSLIPVASPGGRPGTGFGVLLAVQDMTERARLEAELRTHFAQSQSAREQMRAVVEVVSHELRTPLTSVLGYARLLQDRLDAPADRRLHWAELVIDKARLMARLVDEVTDLARIGSERFALQRDWADLPGLVQQVAAEQTAMAERHFFAVEAEPGLPQVWIDLDRIAQVLTNLLTNAAKFWPEGGTIKIAVRRLAAVDAAKRGLPDGGVAGTDEPLVVEVRDGGVGIPPELAEQIFEPFYRVQDERVRGIAGTGLGLAVSRGIVEAHGGRIWAESASGGGTVFRFTVPTGHAEA